ncbi:TetR/AcrR family transcriptional regulator [Actinomadura parmotrematis]|uniref:TetR/AcrR family transcriptional regulator n=1 Tax=Actinomadura parmotrematis TaxID=2864039 RepID=UPI0027E3146B|nr:TetR/AcrR family transcriptional regulator C-terminal domain-containing protein [Actinomadura parmotrematis]
MERTVLSRERIVAAAIVVIERDGAKALSMRKVAAELGVAVMSLYNHVPDRDALIAGVAQAVLADLDAAAGALDARRDWRLNARDLLAAFRDVARRRPRSMHLVLTSRLDLESWWRVAERTLAVLDAAGFGPETSVRAVRALMSYAIGAQMMENGALKLAGGPPDAGFQAALAAPEEFPRTTAVAGELLRFDTAADYDYGLELLLEALDGLPREVKP